MRRKYTGGGQSCACSYLQNPYHLFRLWTAIFRKWIRLFVIYIYIYRVHLYSAKSVTIWSHDSTQLRYNIITQNTRATWHGTQQLYQVIHTKMSAALQSTSAQNKQISTPRKHIFLTRGGRGGGNSAQTRIRRTLRTQHKHNWQECPITSTGGQ